MITLAVVIVLELNVVSLLGLDGFHDWLVHSGFGEGVLRVSLTYTSYTQAVRLSIETGDNALSVL